MSLEKSKVNKQFLKLKQNKTKKKHLHESMGYNKGKRTIYYSIKCTSIRRDVNNSIMNHKALQKNKNQILKHLTGRDNQNK